MNEPRRRPTIVDAGGTPALPGTPRARIRLDCSDDADSALADFLCTGTGGIHCDE